MADTGKATIARPIAGACLDDGRLSASFFVWRGGERETARNFVTTIAMRPRAFQAICEALREQPDVAQQELID